MKQRILLVDDDPATIQVMGRILGDCAELRFATSGEMALERVREQAPDLLLLDAEMPGMSGFQVCEAMQADAALREIPIIFVTSHSTPDFEVKGLEIGAVDFIAKPINKTLLLARVKTQLRIRQLTDELRHNATVDALTALSNRRAFDEALAREWRRSLRQGEPLSLLMVDVDHFKAYNDRYGHPAGDSCLAAVGAALRASALRPTDIVARYGGEEFALLLPNTARAGAEQLAHRVLGNIEKMDIPHATSAVGRHVTVSVGIASYDDESSCWITPSADSRFACELACTPGDLLVAADRALYAAKQGGRAQAWQLDIENLDAPGSAKEIAPWLRHASTFGNA